MRTGLALRLTFGYFITGFLCFGDLGQTLSALGYAAALLAVYFVVGLTGRMGLGDVKLVAVLGRYLDWIAACFTTCSQCFPPRSKPVCSAFAAARESTLRRCARRLGARPRLRLGSRTQSLTPRDRTDARPVFLCGASYWLLIHCSISRITGFPV